MPSLSEMYNLANQKTEYIHTPSEIFAALNEAGEYVYFQVLRKNRGFFVKIDETSLVLTPGTQGQDQIYPLPDDCTQVLHMAERPASSPQLPWAPMKPSTLGKTLRDGWQGFVNWDGFGSGSGFKYAPFLSADETASDLIDAPQTMQVAITPNVDQQRAVQLVYAAKWLPIRDNSSKLMLPREGTSSMYNGAMAILTGDLDDTRQGSFASRAEINLDAFLQWVADRQLQDGMQVETDLL